MKDNVVFVKAVHVDRHIEGIFKLPCVCSVRKCHSGIEYTLFCDTVSGLSGIEEPVVAHVGDWLCEDCFGHWHLLSDDEYKELCRDTSSSHQLNNESYS